MLAANWDYDNEQDGRLLLTVGKVLLLIIVMFLASWIAPIGSSNVKS